MTRSYLPSVRDSFSMCDFGRPNKRIEFILMSNVCIHSVRDSFIWESDEALSYVEFVTQFWESDGVFSFVTSVRDLFIWESDEVFTCVPLLYIVSS